MVNDGCRPFWLFWSNNRWVSIPGLPGGLIIRQGNPSVFPKKDTYARSDRSEADRSEEAMVEAFHGTWWYSLWLVLQTGGSAPDTPPETDSRKLGHVDSRKRDTSIYIYIYIGQIYIYIYMYIYIYVYIYR